MGRARAPMVITVLPWGYGLILRLVPRPKIYWLLERATKGASTLDP